MLCLEKQLIANTYTHSCVFWYDSSHTIYCYHLALNRSFISSLAFTKNKYNSLINRAIRWKKCRFFSSKHRTPSLSLSLSLNLWNSLSDFITCTFFNSLPLSHLYLVALCSSLYVHTSLILPQKRCRSNWIKCRYVIFVLLLVGMW